MQITRKPNEERNTFLSIMIRFSQKLHQKSKQNVLIDWKQNNLK